MKSTNPAFRTSGFREMPQIGIGETMTLSGAINKTIVLFVLLMITAGWTWTQYTPLNPAAIQPYMLGGLIVGFILAMATCFKPNWAPVSAPLYAIAEGFAIGGISAFYNAHAHGIVIQAVALTFGVMAVMLFLYRTGVIKVTEKFRMGLTAAIGGVFLFYLVTWVVGMFGVNTGLMFGGSGLSIGISLVIVAIAALSLVLDFDMMQRASVAGAPKYMEWYSGFALMVTLIWLYMEILRLLGNARQ
ncbi:MAG TPA: Bax inhibitor-1/YccA family protein [Gammaproteobacteria bacterium]|nr:Bax inhibitor-1/YccA family protein [Gammaproteobacteria bacterium]